MTGTAGNKDESARSDCFVKVSLTKKSGIEIDLLSKVKALYGDSIKKLCLDILNFFEVKNAKVEIEDKALRRVKNIIEKYSDLDYEESEISSLLLETMEELF